MWRRSTYRGGCRRTTPGWGRYVHMRDGGYDCICVARDGDPCRTHALGSLTRASLSLALSRSTAPACPHLLDAPHPRTPLAPSHIRPFLARALDRSATTRATPRRSDAFHALHGTDLVLLVCGRHHQSINIMHGHHHVHTPHLPLLSSLASLPLHVPLAHSPSRATRPLAPPSLALVSAHHRHSSHLTTRASS